MPHSAGKQKILDPEIRPSDPRSQCIARLLGDFRLNGTMGFLLHHNRSSGNAVTMRDIPNPQLDQVARSQFAIDRQFEQRQVPSAIRKLQSNPESPDVLEFEGCLLTNEFAFVPRLAT